MKQYDVTVTDHLGLAGKFTFSWCFEAKTKKEAIQKARVMFRQKNQKGKTTYTAEKVAQ